MPYPMRHTMPVQVSAMIKPPLQRCQRVHLHVSFPVNSHSAKCMQVHLVPRMICPTFQDGAAGDIFGKERILVIWPELRRDYSKRVILTIHLCCSVTTATSRSKQWKPSTFTHNLHIQAPNTQRNATFHSSPRCCSRKAGIEGLAFNVTKPLILWYLGWFHRPMNRQEIANFIEVFFVTHFHPCSNMWILLKVACIEISFTRWLDMIGWHLGGVWNWRKPTFLQVREMKPKLHVVLQLGSLGNMVPLFAKQEHVKYVLVIRPVTPYYGRLKKWLVANVAWWNLYDFNL